MFATGITSPRARPQSDPSHRRTRVVRKAAVVAATLLIALGSVSYSRAILTPGYATWNDKTSSWLRDHGASPLMNAYENWRYAQAPADTQPDMAAFQSPSKTTKLTVMPAASLDMLPTLPNTSGQPRPTWTPGRTDAAGMPVAYTSAYQPGPAHRSIVAGVALVRQDATTAHLVEGTTQPTSNPAAPASIPGSDVSSLVATFNSGFKMTDTRGGFYNNGRTVEPLTDGQASVVIDDHGRITVAQWGRDMTMSAHVSSVRQNLALIVDQASPVAGLAVNGDTRWGSAKNQLQYTERSALGITATGDLVYVAAARIDLQTLAHTLVDAGVVRGMKLDIHTGLTAFNSWSTGASGRLAPAALLPGVQNKPDRYLDQDRRDFFYLTVDSATPHQPRSRSNIG